MALTITINGTDRTSVIVPESLEIEQAIREVDTCRFVVRRYGAIGFLPAVEQEVVITDTGTKVFAGYIKTIEEDTDPDSAYYMLYHCECKDYTDLLDRDVVARTYENDTISDIIDDIVDDFAGSGLTTTNVAGTENIVKLVVDYEPPHKVIQALADLVSKDWYVDYDKDIHFFAKEDNAAPFELTDTNGKYVKGSLKIRRDSTQIKNKIIVRGGEYEGSAFTEAFIGDGDQHTFALAYRYRNYSLKVNTVTQTVGLDNINDFTTKDALYNHNEKLLRFDPTSPPANGDTIEFTGDPLLPVLVQRADTASQAIYGVRALRIVDKSIESKELARERAVAELNAYSQSISEGGFTTYESGLHAGQFITISSAIRGFASERFLINRLSGRMRTSDAMVWTASLVTTKTFELLEFLQSLLLRDNRFLKVSENETLDISVPEIIETITVSESITVTLGADYQKTNTVDSADSRNVYLNNPPIWVAGSYNPTGAGDRNRVAFADRGALLGS